MHVAQVMLIEADDLDGAMSEVQCRLEDSPEWSDHHSAWGGHSFAGGYAGEFFGADAERDAIGYVADPALAENIIFEQLSKRKMEIDQLRERVAKSGYDPLNAEYDPEKGKWDMDAYAMKRLITLLEDDWNSDSGIYDLQDWTASLVSFRKRVAVAPEKQFLVVVDFHF